MQVNNRTIGENVTENSTNPKAAEFQRTASSPKAMTSDELEKKPVIWQLEAIGSSKLKKFVRLIPPPPPRPEFFAQKIAKYEALEKSKNIAASTFEELYPLSLQKEINDEFRNRWGLKSTEVKSETE